MRNANGDFRVSIVYEQLPGAAFDAEYYMNRHLPLAVGTSLRHSRILDCDVDFPMDLPGDPPPAVCICNLYFEDQQQMQRFRDLFASGHPDTGPVRADEPNYTTIAPSFNAGQYHGQYSAGDLGAVTLSSQLWRLRMLFPHVDGGLDFQALDALGRVTLDNAILPAARVLSAGLEHMLGGLGSDDVPAFDAVWTLVFDDADELGKALAIIAGGGVENAIAAEMAAITSASPALLASRRVDFDMALAHAAGVRS